MAKTNFKSVDEYHKTFPKGTQERLKSIRDVIHKVVPKVEEVISYQIPCFKYKGYLVYYAAFAKHITLSNPFSEKFLKTFEKDLKDYKVSRAAIQFPNDKELPLVLIKKMVQFRKKENEENELK